MTNSEYSDVTPQIHALAQKMTHNSVIDTDLYSKYNVKRGLRDLDGKGVLTGLTYISTITQNKLVDGKLVPCEGELRYRGYNVKDIVDGILEDDRFGFEEVTYLLLFGDMPNEEQLKDFKKLLVQYRTLPQHFVRDVILKATSNDMMNSIARSVLTLFCYDKNANDTSIDNVLRQCIQLISVFPLLSVYGYHAYNHYQRDNSLYIHRAEPTMSTAEVILSLLRPDRHYTPLEAKVLDMALILHMEHGGGNNSTFTTHVVTSSGTDTYSAVAAALASLKGPKHGGANVKVYYMFEDLKSMLRTGRTRTLLKIILRSSLTSRLLIKKVLSTVWDTQFIQFPTPVSRFFTVLLKSLRLPKVTMMNLIFMRELKDWLRRLSAESVKSIRVLPQMSISTADFFTAFLIFRVSFILRFLQQLVLRVGAHTDLRSLSTAVRLSVLHI